MTGTPTPRRRRTGAAALAVALAAAACSGGGGDTSAVPEPVPTEAAPAETTTAPTTGLPVPTTTVSLEEQCAGDRPGTAVSEERALEARAMMDTGVGGVDLERLAELRAEGQLNAWASMLGCPGGWSDDDEARYQAIVATAERAAEQAAQGESVDEPPANLGDAIDDGAAQTEDERAAEQAAAEAAEQAAADDGHGHDHGPTPDDPEWVDELPEPADPDPAPVGAVLDWDQRKLRPVEQVRPDVCEHRPYNCGPEGRWTWGPMDIAVGTRALSPPVMGETRINSTGRIRSTPCGQRYSYTVTGFAAGDVGVGGLRSVRVLLTQHAEATSSLWEQVESDPIDPLVGCAEAPVCPPPDGAVRCLYRTEGAYIDTSILAVVLPEHADTITYDGSGNMTGATLLLFSSPPLPVAG